MSSAPSATRPLRVLDVHHDERGTHVSLRATIDNSPRDLAAVEAGPTGSATMLLDAELPMPDSERLGRLLGGPCHVWHAGLRLGQGGRPTTWEACHSRAMFSRDADDSIESTSWRMSSRAVLIRNEVLARFGGFDATFDTASGAALDAGLRWLTFGALIRHVPELLPAAPTVPLDSPPSAADGIRVVHRRLGRRWAAWAIFRGLGTGQAAARHLPTMVRAAGASPTHVSAERGFPRPDTSPDPTATVTVLLPTVGRNDYLENLLGQLATQTRLPDEVIVVDQNPAEDRRDWPTIAPTLPLTVIHLLPPGQCTARNTGLRASTGSHILFLDDDDDIPDDLIEQHLEVLASPGVSVSCGRVDDAESGPAPPSLRFRQAGSTFPTNNAMIHRDLLEVTGLFDPTYDRGARADHDLGMRSYLTGHLHVYDPGPTVFHHHAPMGGLRTHGARQRTRGNSRSTILQRHLRSPTDVYLGLRYYTTEQVQEDLVLSAFTTLSGGGSTAQRAARLVVQLGLLPDTWRKTCAARREGEQLLRDRPDLPRLDADPLSTPLDTESGST